MARISTPRTSVLAQYVDEPSILRRSLKTSPMMVTPMQRTAAAHSGAHSHERTHIDSERVRRARAQHCQPGRSYASLDSISTACVTCWLPHDSLNQCEFVMLPMLCRRNDKDT
eukprot:6190522-Pleurochrysis_carterae.AAC.4